jgi:hypothetical protein
MNIMFPPLQWDEVHSGLVMVKKRATLRTCVIQSGLWPCVIWKKIETTKGIHLLNLLSENNPKVAKKPSQKDHLLINETCIGIKWKFETLV